jgi:hypothetical protein
MKKWIVSSLACLLLFSAGAQLRLSDSVARSRMEITRKAMIVLGSWSVANIGSGFALAGSAPGETRYFWLMNGYWGLINLGLAGLGYVGTFRKGMETAGLASNLQAQQAIERLYLINGGLDLLYISAGFYLRDHGDLQTKLPDFERFRGYGSSLVLQGCFLLVMDAVMYSLHHRNTRRLNARLRQLDMGAGPGGLSLRYSF